MSLLNQRKVLRLTVFYSWRRNQGPESLLLHFNLSNLVISLKPVSLTTKNLITKQTENYEIKKLYRTEI